MTFTIDLGTILTSILSGLALAGIVAIFRQLKEMNGSIRELQTVPKRTWVDIPACLKLALWDEDAGKMVRFA